MPHVAGFVSNISSLLSSMLNSLRIHIKESSSASSVVNTYVSYLMSKYAAICMFTAVLLNQTVLFASVNNHTRRRENRVWEIRSMNSVGDRIRLGIRSLFSHKKIAAVVKALLRGGAVLMLLCCLFIVLVSLNCYSPQANKFLSQWELFNYNPDFVEEFYFTPTSYNKTALFGNANASVLIGKSGNFDYTNPHFGEVGPSSSLLYPIFVSVCISQFIETFCSSVSGTQPIVDTSESLFELSLSFFEFDSFVQIKPTVELLALCLMSISNHLGIHFMKITNLVKYRLIISGTIGIVFLGFFMSSILNGDVINFPSIAILSFFFQVVMVTIISLSGLIYLAALLLSADRTQLQFNNFDFGNLNLSLGDDFNTFILKVAVITMNTAVKQSFIEELEYIQVPKASWLDSQLAVLNRKSNNRNLVDSSASQRYVSNYDNCFSSSQLFELHNEKKTDKKFAVMLWTLRNKFTRVHTLTIFFFRICHALIWRKKDILEAKKNLQRVEELLKPSSGDVFYFETEDGEFAINYDKLLNGKLMADTDDISDEDDDEDMLESEIEEELDEDEELEEEIDEVEDNLKESLISEVLEPQQLMSLISDTTSEQSFKDIFTSHLSRRSTKHITRSVFRKSLTDSQSELEKMVDLILEKRPSAFSTSYSEPQHTPEENYSSSKQFECAICQTHPRQIVLWPCACLAICDNCRVSLVLRDFKGCVCCRQPVKGYSKVYMP